MTTLLLDRSHLRIRCDGDALALYESDERRGSVPVKLLERCIIEGAATQLDTGVLLKLAEAGVTTVLLSPRLHQRVALVLGPKHNDAGIRLAQAERVMDDAHCSLWARRVVRAKLRRQQRTLARWLAARPDARKALTDASAAVERALVALTPEAPTLTLAELRGIEGAAARAHFAGLAAVLPPALGFTGRNRRPPRDPANAMLSLGYTLLHADAVHACHISGLDPLLGYYHRPSFGRESMASDLIEPLRAEVDHWVWQLLRDRTLRADHFNHDKGACLLGKAGRSIFYASWAQASRPWRRWLRAAARAVAQDLRGRADTLLSGGEGFDDEDEAC